MNFLDEYGEELGPLDWSVDQVRQWASQFLPVETASTIRVNGCQLCCLLPVCPGIPVAELEALKQSAGADEYKSGIATPRPASLYYYTTYVKRWDMSLLRAWAVLVAGCPELDAQTLAVTPHQLGVIAGFEEVVDGVCEDFSSLPECVVATAAAKLFRMSLHTVAGWTCDRPARYWARHVLRFSEDDISKLATWPEVSGLPWSAFFCAHIEQIAELHLSPDALRVLKCVLCQGLLDFPEHR